MANVKITPEQEAEILRLAGKGMTMRQISAAMKARGLVIHHGTVARFLERTRASRADAAKSAVREKLGAVVLGDLDELGAERDRLVVMAKRFGEDLAATDLDDERVHTKARTYSRVLGDLARITDLRLHYSGADTPDEPIDSGSADRVLTKINALLEVTST